MHAREREKPHELPRNVLRFLDETSEDNAGIRPLSAGYSLNLTEEERERERNVVKNEMRRYKKTAQKVLHTRYTSSAKIFPE